MQKEDLICKYCNKQFSRTYTLNRHLNTCKKKQVQEVVDKDNKLKEELFNTLLKKMEILQQQNDENNKIII